MKEIGCNNGMPLRGYPVTFPKNLSNRHHIKGPVKLM